MCSSLVFWKARNCRNSIWLLISLSRVAEEDYIWLEKITKLLIGFCYWDAEQPLGKSLCMSKHYGINWPAVNRMRVCTLAENFHLNMNTGQSQLVLFSNYTGFTCYIPHTLSLPGLQCLPNARQGLLSWSCSVCEMWWKKSLTCLMCNFWSFAVQLILPRPY